MGTTRYFELYISIRTVVIKFKIVPMKISFYLFYRGVALLSFYV